MGVAMFELPPGHYLEHDPDTPVLRRSDGSMVAAFSARGAAPGSFRRAAEDDAYGVSSAGPPAEPTRTTLPTCAGLQVRFFGDFEVLRDGEALSLGRNAKALAILKYLLAYRERPVSRDHLMGWLWPESSLKKARWSLNSAVSALRKLLGEHPARGASAGCVLLKEGRYQICPTIEVSTDVDEFDTHHERGRRLAKDQQAKAATEYEKAADLYRDDFLVVDLYEDWTMVERQRLLNAYAETLGWLADFYAGIGEYRESVRVCFRLLEKEPCHEHAYRLLMECYVRLGLPTLAARQYGLCEDLLRRRLGSSPSPQTQALYRNILGEQDG